MTLPASEAAITFHGPPESRDDIPLDALGHAVLTGTAFSVDNPRAVRFLDQHAARLVKGVDEGTRSTIRSIVRDGVASGRSSEKIGKDIAGRFHQMAVGRPQAHIDSRAHGIAVTEMTFAYEQGQRDVAAHLEAAGVVTEKSWLTAADDRVDDLCEGNAIDGWIAFETAFSSGDDEPPAHPYCRCTALRRAASDQAAPEPAEPSWNDRSFADTETAAAEGDFPTLREILEERYGVEEVETTGAAGDFITIDNRGEEEAVDWEELYTGEHRAELVRALEEFKKRGIDGLDGDFVQKVVWDDEASGNALATYSLQRRELTVHPNASPYLDTLPGTDASDSFNDVMVHELGHAMDARNPDLREDWGVIWRKSYMTSPDALERRTGELIEEIDGVRDIIDQIEEIPPGDRNKGQQAVLDNHKPWLSSLLRHEEELSNAVPGDPFSTTYARANSTEGFADTVWRHMKVDDLATRSPIRHAFMQRLFAEG